MPMRNSSESTSEAPEPLISSSESSVSSAADSRSMDLVMQHYLDRMDSRKDDSSMSPRANLSGRPDSGGTIYGAGADGAAPSATLPPSAELGTRPFPSINIEGLSGNKPGSAPLRDGEKPGSTPPLDGDKPTPKPVGPGEFNPNSPIEPPPAPVLPDKPDGPVMPDKPVGPAGPDTPSPDRPSERINSVKYPNGNSRQFGRDDKGEVNDIVTRDKEGRQLSHYVKDGDKWYYETPEGMRAKIEGKIQVNTKGDVSFETGNNTWRTERTDGSTAWEKTNPDGSRVSLTRDGKPERITRPDGSSVDAHYENGKLTKFTETDAQGHATTWQKNGDQFVSTTAGKDQRKNVQLDAAGNYSYESSDGFKYNITGDGSKLVDDLGLTTKKDEQGRVKEITYPGGKKVRSFGRDEQGNVDSITTRDEKGERTFTKEGNKWFLDVDGMKLALPGNVQVSAKGDVSFETKPGVWRTEKTNGTVVTEKANDNGSRVALNKQGEVEKIVRKDGSVIEAQYNKDGKPSQITEYSANGSNKTVWVNKGDHWESHPAKEQRKTIELLPNGITTQQGLDGQKRITLGDGRQLTEGPGTAKFAFDKQGRFEAITYPDGDSLKFKYDASGKINEITKSNNGHVVKTETRVAGTDKWDSKDGNGKSLGSWQGEYKVNSNGEVRFKDNNDKKLPDYWTVVQPDGSTYREKLNADGSRTVKNSDKSTVDIDKDGLVRKVSTSKDNYRTFDYDEKGQISKVTDFRKGKEAGSWQPKPGDNDRLDMKVANNGDLTYRLRDGKAVIERADQSKIELDREGYMTKVTQADGGTREFSYNDKGGKKELVSITDRRKSGDKEHTETWNRKANTDGSLTDTFVCAGRDGKSRERKDVTVGRNGDYEYKTNDGKTMLSKAGRDRSADNGFSASVEEARDRLREQMEAHMDEPRRKRFEAILDRFENRAKERVEAQTAGGMDKTKAQEEWDQKVARTYDHLSNMLTNDDKNAPFDLAARAKLVENAAFAMAYPAKANDQGNWGCCWQISGVYLGVIQHPDKMAKMLDELTTKGTFTDVNGKTWTPPAHLLRLTDQGGNWTISNCGNGQRSPVSEIWTSVAAYLSTDGQRMDRGARGGTMEGCMHSMKLITGDEWRGTSQGQMTGAQYKQDLLLKGGVILFSPGHMYLGTLEKNAGQWQIISSVQHGDSGRQVNGVVSDLASWNVSNGGRSQYRPELPNVPGCNDQPIGPKGPSDPNRPDRPNPYQPNPYQPNPYQPNPYQPQPYYPRYYPQYQSMEGEYDQRAEDKRSDDKRKTSQEEAEKERRLARQSKEHQSDDESTQPNKGARNSRRRV